MLHPAKQLKDGGLWKTQAFVSGKWIDAQTGDRFGVTNPADMSILDKVADCGKDETRIAINAAHTAYQSWVKLTGAARGAYLAKLADHMRASL